jgi:hypothetical protein
VTPVADETQIVQIRGAPEHQRQAARRDAEGYESLTFAIRMRAASPNVAPVHHRMPAVSVA